MLTVKKVRRWMARRRFDSNNARLRADGYSYAVCPKTSACCHRLHKIGCPVLMPNGKRRSHMKLAYFKSSRGAEMARGVLIEDKDIIECMACFK